MPGESGTTGEGSPWLRWLTGSFARPDTIEDLCRWQRAVSPIRTLLYLIVASAWCALLSGPTSVIEFAGPSLLVAMLVRIVVTWRVARQSLTQPAWVLSAAYAAWAALSLTWTPDRAQGFDELGTLRWWYLIPALWPVLDRRAVLIRSIKTGFFLANLAQLAHWAGVHFGISAITFPRHADRISGWWDPVVGGSMLVGALGLHLAPLAMAHGRERALAGIGAGVTALAIVATGSRGAWIAGATLGVIAAIAGAVARARRPAPGRKGSAVTIAAAVVAVAGVAWASLRGDIAGRIGRAVHEVREALGSGVYASDTGARILMARWASRELADHPLRGVGAGGFRATVRRLSPEDGALVHDHAHNAILHAGATLGLVGVALGAGAVGVALLCGIREGRSASRADALGPAFALAGLCLVSAFDTIQANAQTAAFVCTLVALCPARLPRGTPA